MDAPVNDSHKPRQETTTGVTYPGLAITYESVDGLSLEVTLEEMAHTIDPSADATVLGDGIYWKQFVIRTSEDTYGSIPLRTQLLEQAHEVLAPYVKPVLRQSL